MGEGKKEELEEPGERSKGKRWEEVEGEVASGGGEVGVEGEAEYGADRQ